MLRLAADENFNNDIVASQPDLDIMRVQEAGLSGAVDTDLLEWAAREGRILLTHDVSTMTHYAYERVVAGLPMPGVFQLSRGVGVTVVIEDILLIAECSITGEWEGQVRYLPLRYGLRRLLRSIVQADHNAFVIHSYLATGDRQRCRLIQDQLAAFDVRVQLDYL